MLRSPTIFYKIINLDGDLIWFDIDFDYVITY